MFLNTNTFLEPNKGTLTTFVSVAFISILLDIVIEGSEAQGKNASNDKSQPTQ